MWYAAHSLARTPQKIRACSAKALLRRSIQSLAMMFFSVVARGVTLEVQILRPDKNGREAIAAGDAGGPGGEFFFPPVATGEKSPATGDGSPATQGVSPATFTTSLATGAPLPATGERLPATIDRLRAPRCSLPAPSDASPALFS